MNVDMEDNRARLPRYFTLEMLMSVMVALSGLVLIWNLVSPVVSVLALFIAGMVFTLSITVLIRLLMDPDSVRARQSSNVLQLASQTLEAMGEEGLDSKSAQRICSLLLPSTAAIAVAITDDRFILGYAGYEESHNLSGSVIRTLATYSTLADGKTRVLFTPEEIGFPKGTHGINAAIIVPLTVGKDVKGTLKFYYRRANHISETQKSIATGFGQLLSTQMAASALEEQTAWQPRWSSRCSKARSTRTSCSTPSTPSRRYAHRSRACPHAAARVREVLPQHARGFRRPDRVPSRTRADAALLHVRAGAFRRGPFGADLQRGARGRGYDGAAVLDPALVENAVRHAMPSEGKLTIRVEGVRQGDDVIVSVIDDGNGMTQEACNNILHPGSTTGCGIAWATCTTASAGISARARIWKWKASWVRAPRCAWFWSKAL